jgi:hypothetical protein
MARPTRLLTVLLLPVLLLTAAPACHRGGGGAPAPAAPGTATGAPATPSATAPGGSSSGGTPGGTTGWGTSPVSVTHQVAVPPVPVVLAARAAAHGGYDRITFDISGPLPSYDARYVSTVTEDASGRQVAMPGRRYLQVRFRPAQGHDDAGRTTLARRALLGLPMLKGYVVTGDFEGVLTVTLGLDDTVGFRAGELPGRVYVDVAA